MADDSDWRKKRLVYSLPDMELHHSRSFDLPYKTAQDGDLRADIYAPSDVPGKALLPAVIFISGDAPPEIMKDLKNASSYVCWGQLVATSGMVAVTFDHRSTEDWTKLREVEGDVADLISFVRANGESFGIDVDNLCIWVCSAGPPFGLRMALRDRPPFVRCIVAYYGILDMQYFLDETVPPKMVELSREFSPVNHLQNNPGAVPPMLIVRAGQDRPPFTRSIDHFVAEALAHNLDFELINYPSGHHGFDIFDDTQQSRAIIRRTLDFMREHLLGDKMTS